MLEITDSLRGVSLLLQDQSTAMNELADRVNSHFWWHSIDLGNGIITPGRGKSLALMKGEFADTFSKLDLNGKSVIDIGAWNGGFSLESVRRGAKRVVGLDHYTWNEPRFRGRETFDLVNEVTGSGMEAVDVDLDQPRLSLGHLGKFDVVLFLGVFYHLKDPIAALREVAGLASDVLVLETALEHLTDPRPAMIFYPGAELSNDPTNWWGPNSACVVELLKMFGFERIEMRQGAGGPGRGVFHAFRQ